MNQQTVLNVELQDVDVEYSVLHAPTATDFSEVEITKVTFRGIDITGTLKRKEISSIALDIEHDLDKPPLFQGSCMSKHTPSAWNISDELTTDKHFVIDLGHDVSGCVLVERHIEGKDGSDLPNARLIAAAPDLLDALKMVKKMLDDGILVRDVSRDHKPDWALEMMHLVQDLNKINIAIIKAEGA